METHNQRRITYLSVLSVISCIAIVYLHANKAFRPYTFTSYWMTSNVIQSVMYFGVPIFFMISGATLIDYRERYSTKEFFQKRIKKVVIPFIFWSLYGLYYFRLDFKDLTLLSFINSFINTKFNPIYWFFIPLLSIYEYSIFVIYSKRISKTSL